MGSYPTPPARAPACRDLTPVTSNRKTPASKPVSILRRGCFYTGPPLACSSPIKSPCRSDLLRPLPRRRVTFDVPDEASASYAYEDGSMQFGDIEEYVGSEEQNVMDMYGADVGRAALYQMMGKSENELDFGGMLPFGDDMDDSGRFGTLYEDEEAPMYSNVFRLSGELEDHEDTMESIHGAGSGDELSVASTTLDDQEPLIGDGNAASSRVRAIEGLPKMEEARQEKLGFTRFADGWDEDALARSHSRDESVSSETSSESPKGIQDFPEDPQQEFISKQLNKESCYLSPLPGEVGGIE
eukprot:CAMPEP_0117050108 /NCGR_PEP_ID=MMETSP0472-20121206/34597_1 /TAXON_ID=693140 ORGANISM="Tiarina fusus, Strain LIS" /NCGR_SAMPLE_ID=MMETSP0472 /ASSEMBLY_ACC=CAM_ASM_000603 /LENGTH=298 /DNA_ID=CAMNT_0004763765 /DNA_START=675 /DNA_END=1571 /DNA_ORIENTATION=+